MGTNFYFKTKVKEFAEQFVNYDVDDRGDGLHYEIHLAKTSAGWLPLFQAHKGVINSVKDIENLYNENYPKITIVDEYGEEYSWQEFKTRVIDFNGGVDGAIPKSPIEKLSPGDIGYDHNLPDYAPISHFDYKGYMYHDLDYLFKDENGYEFDSRNFR